MTVIITTVQLKPGTIDDVVELFKASNYDLVKDEPDWQQTFLTYDEKIHTVRVLAFWSSAEAFYRFKESEKYQAAMNQYSAFFKSPPQISVGTVMHHMHK